ncbi:MAG: DNA mismatch repair protein MutS [Chlamydiales bacterium]|nr:DNA mismatch repair protein MutS [Chlamydiales bacterium]
MTDAIKTTPMMAQWHACKQKAKDSILLFRMGDFYEAFYDDATTLSEVVDLTLTQRQGIPMAGIPHHTCDAYIDKLVQKGLKVAIAEQLEDPKTVKGLVKRDIVRIITPGTLLNSSLLTEKSNNFFASIVQIGHSFGLSFIDLSTGDFKAMECEKIGDLANELYALRASEILISHKFQERHSKFFHELSQLYNFLLSPQDEWYFDHHMAYNTLSEHFNVHNLDGFGLKGMNSAITAAGSLLHYFKETLSLPTQHIHAITHYEPSCFLKLDKSTQRNLELVESMRNGSKKYTLLEVLDYTRTPMGGRLLKNWILQPLLDLKEIHKRQESITSLLTSFLKMQELAVTLGKIKDIERLTMKISSGYCGPRDLLNLILSLETIPELKCTLLYFSSLLFEEESSLLTDFTPLVHEIKAALVDEPPVRTNEGGIFREGYDKDLDELREIRKDGKSWLINYQNKLREETGIKTLKVSFTHAFGYYIEVSKGQAEKMPASFQRRQTLVNNERFITPELKEYEQKVLTAEERMIQLEQEFFTVLRTHILKYTESISLVAKAISKIDALYSLAFAAKKWNYTKPIVDTSSILFIQEGRHPIIESSLLSEIFTPNDTLLDDSQNSLILLTGPNMAGKSTYIRQVALITLMAQMGSFVPAKSAHIGLVDKIFTRIGASDDLSRGQSTFMVEMSETATILHNATFSSLVILDEIGRGTSTYDGIAIAWSVAEYLLLNIPTKAKTLFATHYWELTELQNRISGAVNYHVAVQEANNKIIFLHKIIKGATDKSYGIHVAELAGLPLSVTLRAKEILNRLEEGSGKKEKSITSSRIKKPIHEHQILLFE